MAPQTMPSWWFYLFAGWTVMGMGGLMYQHLATPAAVFAGGFPKGYDGVVDGLANALLPGSSPRLEYLIRSTAGSFIYILGTEVFITLYARTLPPPYQKGVLARLIWPALLSDAFLVGLALYAHPEEVIRTPAKWTDTLQGVLVFVPIGSLIKLLWVFGVGAPSRQKSA